MSKRVLILANSSSGLYQFRNELIQELIREEYEVHVSLPDDTNNTELSREGCVIYRTSINRRGMNPLQDLSLLGAYKRLIRRVDPVVVLTYTIKPNVYGGWAAAMAGVPYIANITGLGSALENGGVLQKVALTLYRIGLKKAMCVFTQNQSNLDFCREHKMTTAPMKLLPGSGVNLTRFAVTKLPSEEIEFLFISRVMREKGIEEYLEAAKRVVGRHPEVRFSILGQCEEDYSEVLKQAEAEGYVHYVGRVHDVRSYIAAAQAVIHPSFYPEGMSNVCLEAAASGRAVITTDRPGCRETVIDGETGYIVPVRDADALTEAIERYLALDYDERWAMGMTGRKYVEQHFDRKLVVGMYMQEIRECI